MAIPANYREERRKAAGVEVQEKLWKLQGQSRNDVLPDRGRESLSPLGGGQYSAKRKEQGRGR